MGPRGVTVTVRGPGGERGGIDFLVDGAATDTPLPNRISTASGLARARRLTFTLADSTRAARPVAERRISIPQGSGPTPVIPDGPGDRALLGVVVLGVPGRSLNPCGRTLQPMRMVLA